MLKLNRLFFVTILLMFFSFSFYCTSKNPLDMANDFINDSDGSSNSLAKLPTSESYLSSRADLQIMFSNPGYDWKVHDLTEGGTIILLHSPKTLLNSPAEDLLPRFTIVEMTHKIDKGRLREAYYRTRKLREKYGEENVETLVIEDSYIGGIVCTHFSYKVHYPVNGKNAITDEYGFYQNHYYYIIQFSKSIDDGNNELTIEAFNKVLNSLTIIKSLIS